MPFRRAAILLVALSLPVLRTDSATAQQADPAAFWYALEAALTEEEVAATPPPSSLEPRVAESLRLLRRYELAPERSTAYRARWELQRAVRAEPANAWHQLALAMVLRRGPDAHVRNSEPKSYYFVDPRSLASMHALRALRRALELDPQFELAAVELARFAVERHDAELLAEADRALAGQEPTGEVLLQRAAIALELRALGEAQQHATAARLAGADAGRVAHTVAVALLLDSASQRMGAAAYLDGLARPSEAALREYQRAAAPVFTRAEILHWETLAPQRRASWLRELWELRAALSGVSLEERLGEHFRRLYTAHAQYPLFRPLFKADLTGGLSVMMGEEVRRHGLSAPGLMLTRFGDPGRLRWIGLCGTDDIPYLRGWEQVREGYAPPALPTAGVLDEFVPVGEQRPVDVMDLLLAEDSRLLRSTDCSNTTSLRRLAERLTDGDRYRPSFAGRLPVQVEVYAFRGSAGADVITGFTLPRRETAGLTDASGTLALHTALAVIDSAARRTSRSEQLIRARVNYADPAAGWLLFTISGSTPLHGTLEMRLTVSDAERRAGSVVALRHDIPDFDRPGLILSDLVIAPPGPAERLRRGDVTLGVAAGRRYRSGEAFDLYYEIYGLPADAAYRTRIVLAPQGSRLWRAIRQITGGEPDVMALQFEERAGTPHALYGVQQLRQVSTASLRPGTYRLLIEVTNQATGETTTRERLLDIHE